MGFVFVTGLSKLKAQKFPFSSSAVVGDISSNCLRALMALLALPPCPDQLPPGPPPGAQEPTPSSPRAIGPCPSKAAAGLVSSSSQPGLGPHQGGPTHRLMSHHGLSLALSPGRWLMPRAVAVPHLSNSLAGG